MREYSNSFFKDKQIYLSRDVQTSNPRKLFRYLSDILDKLGYETDYDTDSVQIRRDEVGDSGYVNALIVADRNIEVEQEGIGSHYLDMSDTSKLELYTLIAGILAFLAGMVMMLLGTMIIGVVVLLIGIAVAIGVILSKMKRRSAFVIYPVSLWIAGAGEIYRAHLTESRGLDQRAQGLSQDQVISELTVRIAADSVSPVRLEELDQDIRYLLEQLETIE